MRWGVQPFDKPGAREGPECLNNCRLMGIGTRLGWVWLNEGAFCGWYPPKHCCSDCKNCLLIFAQLSFVKMCEVRSGIFSRRQGLANSDIKSMRIGGGGGAMGLWRFCGQVLSSTWPRTRAVDSRAVDSCGKYTRACAFAAVPFGISTDTQNKETTGCSLFMCLYNYIYIRYVYIFILIYTCILLYNYTTQLHPYVSSLFYSILFCFVMSY